MDFAKKILGKYGWKEGDGLGKNNDGIAKPLKASLKFDHAGLGVDRATEFNDHWWERCFNEAASNVDVKVQHNGQVSTARKLGEEAVEISTKAYSVKKLKRAKEQQTNAGGVGVSYDNFLQSATLTKTGGELIVENSIKVEDIAVTAVNVLSDEELFRACGGRTAHKGARHGLKSSGKLARLEQQEREMLQKMQATNYEVNNIHKTTKMKRKNKDTEENSDLEAKEQLELRVKSKKNKKNRLD